MVSEFAGKYWSFRVFEIRVVRRTFGSKREGATEYGGKWTVKSFVNCFFNEYYEDDRSEEGEVDSIVASSDVLYYFW
jgi:hypothetical protein